MRNEASTRGRAKHTKFGRLAAPPLPPLTIRNGAEATRYKSPPPTAPEINEATKSQNQRTPPSFCLSRCSSSPPFSPGFLPLVNDVAMRKTNPKSVTTDPNARNIQIGTTTSEARPPQ